MAYRTEVTRAHGTRRFLSVILVLAVCPLGMLCAAGAKADEQADDAVVEDRIWTALDEPGEWEYVQTPLEDVVADVAKRAGVDVLLDVRALEESGIATDTPMTVGLDGVTLRSFLHLALRPLDLTFEVRDAAIYVTTPERAESRLRIDVYPVGDLLAVVESGAGGMRAPASLIERITSTIAPDSWCEVGGPGAIKECNGSLVVSQTEPVHEKLGRLLAAYRLTAERFREEPTRVAEPVLFALAPGDDKVHAALRQPVTFEVVEEPLADVLEFIRDLAGIPVLLDARALDDIGVPADVPMTATAKQLSLRTALARLLEPHELTWIVREGALVITTREESEQSMAVGFYPVWDLVGGSTSGSDAAALDVDPLASVAADLDRLINALTGTVAPDSWDEVGGPGTIASVLSPPALVISQPQDIHDQIGKVLADLRAARRTNAEAVRSATPVDADKLQVRAYSVLVANSMDRLIELLQELTGPEMWQREGVLLEPLDSRLIIRQTPAAHREIGRILRELNVVWQPGPGGGGLGHDNMGGGSFGGFPPGTSGGGGAGGGGFGGGGFGGGGLF